MSTLVPRERSFATRVARLLSFAAAAIFVTALTIPASHAQPVRLKQPNTQAALAKLLGTGAKPVQASPKSCVIEYFGDWYEECYEVGYPGYTDRDWDYYLECDWVWEEFPVEVCQPDCTDPPPGAAAAEVGTKAATSAKEKYLHRPGDALELAPIRTYRANAANRSAGARQQFGEGWYSTWDRSITVVGGGKRVQVTRGDGTELAFIKKHDGTWDATPRVANTFLSEYPGEKWLLIDANWLETYDSSGRLRRLTSREALGGSFELNYTSDGMLDSVVDLNGKTLRFAYTDGHVSTVIGPDGGLTTFSYQDGRMTATTYPNGDWREFRYDPSGRASYVRHGKGSKSLKTERAPLPSSLSPILGGGPDTTGVPEPSDTGSCPVPWTPCEDWMRQEIAQCTYAALIDKENWMNALCIPILSEPASTLEEVNDKFDRYQRCQALVEAKYVSAIAACTSKYPQCY